MMWKERVVIMKWKKVSLVVPEKEDIYLWYKWKNDLEISHYLWEAHVVRYFEKMEELYEKIINDDSGIYFSVMENSSKKIIWFVDLKDIRYLHKTVEVWMWIFDVSSHWKWYWTEMLRLICDYAFRIQWMRKIFLEHFLSNKVWIKVYEKVWFEVVWIKKEHFFSNWWYEDLVIREIFTDEFYKKNKEYFEK